MILLGDLGHGHPQLVHIDAVLLRVCGQDHRIHRCRRQSARRAVVGGKVGVRARKSRVFELVATDGHGNVVGTAGHGVSRLPQRLRTSGAIVLDASHRLALQLEGRGKHDARTAGNGHSEPVGIDLLLGDANRCQHLVGRIDQEVVPAEIEVLPERGARHANDGDAVLDAIRAHAVSLDPIGRAFQK